MLTKIRIQNFKQFDDVEIELGPVTVLIGPNNSGKTTILQALMLWYRAELLLDMQDSDVIGAFLSLATTPGSGTNVLINRYDLISMPIPRTEELWRNLKTANGGSVSIDIELHGINDGKNWQQGFGFGFENSESVKCIPLQALTTGYHAKMAFLPSVSGLTPTENLIQRGAINRLVGEGRTAEVIRNICLNVYENTQHWQKIVGYMRRMFGVEILSPQYLAGPGFITMRYRERAGIELDISAAGRGMLQILLILAYMYDNPRSVLLLDEPDAHLEILRQQELYRILSDVARELDSQIIMATHSEVIMNAAGDKDVLIACVGKPHRIDNNNTSQKEQVAKALTEFGHDQYFLALQRQWVLYLEGATDLSILYTFAQSLKHPAAKVLERPFTKYIGNVVKHARDHFYALREALGSLKGIAILDHPYIVDQSKDVPKKQNNPKSGPLSILYWEQNEIENYLWQPETLIAYARSLTHPDAVSEVEATIKNRFPPFALSDRQDEWWRTTKASEFLTTFFKAFFSRLDQYNVMDKASFYILAPYVPAELIDPEVIEKLDAIWDIAKDAPNT